MSLARSKPGLLLTSSGDTEFTNGVELRVFRKEWTRREARPVLEEFLRGKPLVSFKGHRLELPVIPLPC
jgi:hypothetical protein